MFSLIFFISLSIYSFYRAFIDGDMIQLASGILFLVIASGNIYAMVTGSSLSELTDRLLKNRAKNKNENA